MLEHARLLQLDNNCLRQVLRMKIANTVRPSRIIAMATNNEDNKNTSPP